MVGGETTYKFHPSRSRKEFVKAPANLPMYFDDAIHALDDSTCRWKPQPEIPENDRVNHGLCRTESRYQLAAERSLEATCRAVHHFESSPKRRPIAFAVLEQSVVDLLPTGVAAYAVIAIKATLVLAIRSNVSHRKLLLQSEVVP